MANAIYEQFREVALGSGLDWLSQDYRAALVKSDTADGFGLEITAASAATPIAITTAAPHGLASGAIVSITQVLGNTAANGHHRITVTGASTFTLADYLTDASVASNGVFDASLDPNYIVLSGPQFLVDIPAPARHALLPASIGSKAIVAAAADSADWTWLAVAADGGNDSDYVIIYEETGVEATSRLLLAISLATGLPVIPNGGDISFVVNSNVHRMFRL